MGKKTQQPTISEVVDGLMRGGTFLTIAVGECRRRLLTYELAGGAWCYRPLFRLRIHAGRLLPSFGDDWRGARRGVVTRDAAVAELQRRTLADAPRFQDLRALERTFGFHVATIAAGVMDAARGLHDAGG